jgi:hypothetical protein
LVAFSTVAPNCTISFDTTFCGIGEIVTDTAWVPVPTVWVSADDKLPAKLVSPKYCAVMGCEPAVSDDGLTVATPPVSGLVPMDVGVPLMLSMKLTFPVGVPPPVVLLTSAVMRTDAPTAAGFGEELSAMIVGVIVGTEEVGFTVSETVLVAVV